MIKIKSTLFIPGFGVQANQTAVNSSFCADYENDTGNPCWVALKFIFFQIKYLEPNPDPAVVLSASRWS
jgi:hypothetical protein